MVRRRILMSSHTVIDSTLTVITVRVTMRSDLRCGRQTACYRRGQASGKRSAIWAAMTGTSSSVIGPLALMHLASDVVLSSG
ncbi:MAG: hypothetical protein QOF69_2291 [Solirubrobacteraceae bacterium]|nr:hypothetical protein [Solirubrobacteraceae bacterium]